DLRLGVGVSVLLKLSREDPFQLGVPIAMLRMDAQVIAEQQRELLRPAAGSSHMDVRPTRPGCLAEVALRLFGVLGAKHQTQPLQRHAIGINGIEYRYGDLDIDNGLGSEARHSR